GRVPAERRLRLCSETVRLPISGPHARDHLRTEALGGVPPASPRRLCNHRPGGTPIAALASPEGAAMQMGPTATVLVLLVGLLVVVGIGVKLYDLKRKREAEAVHLQAQVSDALLREQALFGLPITPTVRVPTWKGSPATIDVAGQVPTPEFRETAIRIIRSEAARIRQDF